MLNNHDFLETIEKQLSVFNKISLEDTNQVKLMNRTDTKYWFKKEYMLSLLEKLKDNYFVVNINSQNIAKYNTVYFDTPDNQLYLAHHNQHLNRLKIRKRTYLETHQTFLERKVKTNKSKTKKQRILSTPEDNLSNQEDKEFLASKKSTSNLQLLPTLSNNFQRITLVSKLFNERSTIDLSLEFENDHHAKANLHDIVIFEIKRERTTSRSFLLDVLQNFRLKPEGFSKYCIGRALLEPEIKQNNFKQRIRKIRKLCN